MRISSATPCARSTRESARSTRRTVSFITLLIRAAVNSPSPRAGSISKITSASLRCTNASKVPSAGPSRIRENAGTVDMDSIIRTSVSAAAPNTSPKGRPITSPGATPRMSSHEALAMTTSRLGSRSASSTPYGWMEPGMWIGSRSQFVRSTGGSCAANCRSVIARSRWGRTRVRSGVCGYPLSGSRKRGLVALDLVGLPMPTGARYAVGDMHPPRSSWGEGRAHSVPPPAQAASPRSRLSIPSA